MTTPYTYLIGWSHLDRWYYGVRFAKKCTPSELWKTYHTSSKHVARFRLEHGDPDVIEVRKTFASVDSARLWEQKVLIRMGVVSSERWLNKNDVKSIDPAAAAQPRSEAAKQKMRKPKSEEHRRKIGLARKAAWERVTLEQRKAFGEKSRLSLDAHRNSPENRVKNSIANSGENNRMYGKKHSPESIEKMRLNRKGKGTAKRPNQSAKMKEIWARRKMGV